MKCSTRLIQRENRTRSLGANREASQFNNLAKEIRVRQFARWRHQSAQKQKPQGGIASAL